MADRSTGVLICPWSNKLNGVRREVSCAAGSAVANYSTSTEPRLLKFTILLNSTVNSPPMTPECQERYRLALVSDLRTLSRTVNYRICTGVMCPYITGAPGSGVPVDRSADPHVVFVAIDTAALNNLISFNVVASTVSNSAKT